MGGRGGARVDLGIFQPAVYVGLWGGGAPYVGVDFALVALP